MKKLVYILGMLFLYATVTYGQGITMTIGSKTASVGDTVTVPISVTNFNNIGAVSLKIQYNPASLLYVGVTNQPSIGSIDASTNGSEVAIAWFSTSPLNIGDGKFLDLKFVYSGSHSSLVFNTIQCEVSNISGNPLVIDYVNGGVSAITVTKLSLPQLTAVAGNNISIPLSIENYQDVGSVSLKIAYDPAVIEFIDAVGPSSGSFASGASGGILTIGWFDTNPLNVTDGILANLNFKYRSNSSDLVFNTSECHVTNLLGNELDVEYVNGHITFDVNSVPKFTIGQVVAVPGSNIVVPLDVQKLNKIGAVSLKIQYNNAVLTYVGTENQPAAGTFNAGASGGVITIGWFNTSAFNIDSGKFVDLKFAYIGGESDLIFTTAQCEISDSLGNTVNALYTNGKVSQNPNSIPTIKIADIVAVGGDDITIPISVNHFQNVGAVSLKIDFDAAVLSFTDYINQPSAGSFNASASGGVLTIGWFNTNPFGTDSAKLVDLHFHYIGGASTLSFNVPQCDVTDTLANPLFPDYLNGSVIPEKGTVPQVMLKNLTAAPGSTVTMPLVVNNFQNVAAASLKIEYDPTVITFTGVTNQPANGTFNASAVGGVLTIGWFNTDPFGQDSVKFVDLNFNFIGGTSSLTFNRAQCEISDSVGTSIYTDYIDGMISLEPNSYPIIRAGNKAAKVGDTVIVPLNVQKLNDVGAVSLKIQYNNTVLTYIGTENQPAAGTFDAGVSGGVLTIGWFNTIALGIDSGKFVDLKFAYNGGSSSLAFLIPQCEITKTNGDAISYVQYIDGSVSANVPPQFTAQLPDTTTINENQAFTFQYKATDANIDSKLFFKLITDAVGSKLDSLTGIFSWTPTYDQAGTYHVVAVVSDGVLTDTSNGATIVVKNVDRAPVFDSTLVSPVTTFEPNKTDSLVIHATDPDGDTVTYLFSTPPPVPSGATINQTSGLFVWVKDLTVKEGSSIPIRFRATDGTLSVGKTITFVIHTRTNVITDPGIPKEYSLKQNYPNPFNPATKIKYAIPEESKVVLRIYNILGQQVAQLVNEIQRAGYYSVDFNASSLASGIYLYKIEAKNFNSVKKMILIK